MFILVRHLRTHWAEATLAVCGLAAVMVTATFSIKPAATSQPPLMLESEQVADSVEARAIQIRNTIEELGVRAVPSILRGVPDEGPFHFDTVFALSQLGEQAVPSLIEAFTDPNPDTRVVALRALGGMAPRLGDEMPGLMEGLAKLLYDPSDEVRYAVVLLLGRLNTDRRAAVSGLIDTLTIQADGLDEDLVYLRQGAAYVLGKIGPPAAAAIPALKRVMRDPDFGVQQEAAVALWRISRDPKMLLPELTQFLVQTNSITRRGAVRALSRIRREMRADGAFMATMPSTRPTP